MNCFSRQHVGFVRVYAIFLWALWCVTLTATQDAVAENPFADQLPATWTREWPNTDFSKFSVTFGEIQSGGPSKDGIPAIDAPRFVGVSRVDTLRDTEPVISLSINGETKIYPLRIMTWHEIVNDRIGGVPVAVTYCPLCNAAIVFDARLDGTELTFGTTGKLRNSDLVMYDRQTESWWQQFSGEAIVGEFTGQSLRILPSRLDSFSRAKAAHPDAQVLLASPTHDRPYGSNPYVGYDTSVQPFLYAGDLPGDINPMMRVVVVGDKAWTLPYLQRRERVTDGDLVVLWAKGQNSALDTRLIENGRDVGNVVVQRLTDSGQKDVVHHVTFAFVFHAFHPEGQLIQDD